jgi:hypothetical protein
VLIPVHFDVYIVLALLTVFELDISISILVAFSACNELNISAAELSVLTPDHNHAAVAIDVLRVPGETSLVFLRH